MKNWHIVFSGICCAASVVIATSFTFYRALPAAIPLLTPDAKVGHVLAAYGNGGTGWLEIPGGLITSYPIAIGLTCIPNGTPYCSSTVWQVPNNRVIGNSIECEPKGNLNCDGGAVKIGGETIGVVCSAYEITADALYVNYDCIVDDEHDANRYLIQLIGAALHLPVKPMSERK